jgi:hypothetical protein
MWFTPVIPAMWEAKVRELRSKPSWAKHETLSKKTLETKGLGRVQVLEHFPNKHKGLSSNLSTAPKKITDFFLIIKVIHFS